MKLSLLVLASVALVACGGATVPGATEDLAPPAATAAAPPSPSSRSRELFVCWSRPELAPALACLERTCAAGDGTMVRDQACMLDGCERELEALERASGACYWCAVVELLDGATFAGASSFCGAS